MARHDASELAHCLARDAELVCRHYLSAGRRKGRYLLAGDVRNTPGRSMFVRLKESVKGPAGKWTEYAASRVMLPSRDWALSCGRSTTFAQHNASTWGGA